MKTSYSKKICIGILCFAIFLICFNYAVVGHEVAECKSMPVPHAVVSTQTYSNGSAVSQKTDSVIALLLYSYIDTAITNYFGERIQYALYDAKVDNITQIDSDFAYKVTITVQTFHGAHNPPYGLETMTFSIRAGNVIELENYKHVDI